MGVISAVQKAVLFYLIVNQCIKLNDSSKPDFKSNTKVEAETWETGFCDSIPKKDCFHVVSNYITMDKVISRPKCVNIQLRPNEHIGLSIILLLAGDVSLNPGPDSCVGCKVPVHKNRRKVKCDDCEDIYHATCAKISSKKYGQLIQNQQIWLCQMCKPEPCGMCDQLVTKYQKGMECDNCRKWVHTSCGGIEDLEYLDYVGKSCTWMCPVCDMMIFSDSLFNSSSGCDTSNQFSLLDGQEDESLFSNHDEADLLHQETTASLTQENQGSNRSKTSRNLNSRNCSSNDSLRIMLVNFQSISNKNADMQILVDEFNPDIIQGTETWLSPNVKTSEILLDSSSYDVYRRDRKKGIHGGILIACKKDLILTKKEEFDSDDSELMWHQLELKGRHPLLFGTCYKHRHDDRDTVTGLEESFEKISSKKKKKKKKVITSFLLATSTRQLQTGKNQLWLRTILHPKRLLNFFWKQQLALVYSNMC